MNSDLLAVLNADAADSPSLLAAVPPSPSASSPFALGGKTRIDASSFSDPPVQWGPSLVLIHDHMSICGGCIGPRKNNCFCVASLDDGTTKGCAIGRHALMKHPLVTSEDALYTKRIYLHKGAGKNAAYADPWVDASSLTTSDLAMLLGKRYASWEEWKADAVVFQAAAASKQEVEKVQTAVKATRIVKRSGSAGKNLFGTDEGQWKEQDLEAKLKQLGIGIQRLVTSGALDWVEKSEGEMTEEELRLKTVGGKMRLLEEAVVGLNDAVTEGLQELQLGVAVRLAGMESVLGAFTTLGEQKGFEGATITGAIEHLQEQVEEVKSSEVWKNVASQVMKSSEMDEFSRGLTEAFKKVMRRIIGLEEEMASVRLSAQKSSDRSLASVTSAHSHDWLGGMAQMEEMERDDGAATKEEREGKEFKEMLTSLARRVDSMEKNGGMNSKLEGEDISVFFMGVRFSSERDVSSYVQSKSHTSFVLPVGLITDCYSIFYELNRELFDSRNKLGVTDLAKVAQLAKKQADVYNILAGVEHGLPDFFDPPSSASKIYIDGKQGKKHRFGNLPSYEVWGPVGADGFTVRKKATGALTRLVTTRKSEIKEQVKQEKLQAFLLSMLDMSKEFVTAVFAFLTEEYAALSQHFDDGSLCWDFACSCVEHVFKHEFETARAVVRNPDVVDDSISSKILWQSLRTIAVQETFMRVGFKNHPSLASAYSKFLLTQYQKTAGELNRVSKELDACTKICMNMAASVEALEKRLKAAEGTANAAQNAVQKLKRGND
jgi:hypothetical protein